MVRFLMTVWMCRLFPSNASATDLDQNTLNSTILSLGKAVAVLVGANSTVNASADFLTSTTTVVYAHCE